MRSDDDVILMQGQCTDEARESCRQGAVECTGLYDTEGVSMTVKYCGGQSALRIYLVSPSHLPPAVPAS